MDTAFVIGNGESRAIFPIDELKTKGIIYGCNAIYRDHPTLCDHIVAVNPPMYEELKNWYDKENPNLKIHGPNDISEWSYIMPGDTEFDTPSGLKIYRIWRGGNYEKHGNKIRTIDFAQNRGSGMSALLLAAESGVKNIVLLAFDILGAKQWEAEEGIQSRIQNNVYKNTENYPSRMNMKAYLKYEWLFQLRQIIRKFPKTNFYFINRKEYVTGNSFLRHYFMDGNKILNTLRPFANVKTGIYADLRRWVDGKKEDIKWISL